jgi:DNA modification methylase
MLTKETLVNQDGRDMTVTGVKVLDQAQGKNWTLYQGDCAEVIRGLPDNSIDFGIHSPPFAETYIYSDSIRDMGNCADWDEFFVHYGFLIEELYRTTVPGRLCSVHCKDLPLYRGRDNAAGLRDFPGAIVQAFEAKKWVFHSRVTIWKDPVVERARTNNHGLLHKNFVDRSEVCRQGMADYLLVFRKWSAEVETTESPRPVKHFIDPKTHNFAGENRPTHWKDRRDYSIQVWQRYASPVWFDIDQTKVLNFQIAKDSKDEKHICPLQLDVISRSVELWTNPGDVVFDPYNGIGSTGFEALKLGRKYIGIELKESYFSVAKRNLTDAEQAAGQTDIFTAAGVEVEGVA